MFEDDEQLRKFGMMQSLNRPVGDGGGLARMLGGGFGSMPFLGGLNLPSQPAAGGLNAMLGGQSPSGGMPPLNAGGGLGAPPNLAQAGPGPTAAPPPVNLAASVPPISQRLPQSKPRLPGGLLSDDPNSVNYRKPTNANDGSGGGGGG